MHTPSILLQKAVDICHRYHARGVDRDGMPRIFHSLRVAMKQTTFQRICVGLLHDVIEEAEKQEKAREDIFVSFADHQDIIDAVECLTRGQEETWNSYYARVRKNKDACWVKIADIEDNFSPSRADARMAKQYPSYLEEYEILCDIVGITKLIDLNFPLRS